MTKRHHIELESVIFLLAAAGIGFVLALYAGHKPQFQTHVSLPVMQSNENPSPTASPTPLIPKPEVSSQISPDGTKQLTMTVTSNSELSKTYTFVTSDADGTNQKTVYTASYNAESMSIPFNTWSPDDKYVFVIHTLSSGTEALVMRADGQPLTDTDPNFNLMTIFNAKDTGNTYKETTGWAANTLLIVNTTTKDGSKGPSYWVEIPSKAIIQLSSEF
jgi:hypothetical protein